MTCVGTNPKGPATRQSSGRGSGSGGNAVEAIADLLSIARLPPGHDPGAGCGVATLPGSGGTWPLDILVCSAARWPPQTRGRYAPVSESPADGED